MHRIILTEKYSPSTPFFWPNLIKDKRIEGLSVEEIVNKYQGFEGDLVCFYHVKDYSIELKKVIDQFLELKKLSNCLILHVVSEDGNIPPSLKEQISHVGYDVGVCEEEKTIYSSIFNEILFGHLDELVVYKDLLNRNLLFPDRSLAEKYVSLHNELSAQGKGVEDYEAMIIYEVWKQKE